MVVSRWKKSVAVSFMAEKSSREVMGWQISNVLILWADYESARYTDKLKSYPAALREMGCEIPHDTIRYHNNIAEISHQKTRQQQRQIRQFKSIGQVQRFLSCHGVINNHFRQQRHLLKARHYRSFRERAFDEWSELTCAQNLSIAA